MARRRSSFLNSQISGRKPPRTPQGEWPTSVPGATKPPSPKKGRYESIVRRFDAQKKRGHFRDGLKDRLKEVGGSIDKSGRKPELRLPGQGRDFGMTSPPSKPEGVKLPPGDGSVRTPATPFTRTRGRRRRRAY